MPTSHHFPLFDLSCLQKRKQENKISGVRIYELNQENMDKRKQENKWRKDRKQENKWIKENKKISGEKIGNKTISG